MMQGSAPPEPLLSAHLAPRRQPSWLPTLLTASMLALMVLPAGPAHAATGLTLATWNG